MTDLERTKQFLDSLGIGYTEGSRDEDTLVLEMQAGRDTLVEGYDGFVASFLFTKDGRFSVLKVWE